MLVAPLLPFLAHALVHHDNAVVAQSADNGFRYAATRRNLRHARLVGYGVYDVGRCRLAQFLARHDGDWCRRVLQLGVARHTRHHHLVQFQVTVEHVRRVRRVLVVIMMLMMMLLRCRSHTYPQQRQDEIYLFHSVVFKLIK